MADVRMQVEMRIRWWATWLSKGWRVVRWIPWVRGPYWNLMLKGCWTRLGPSQPWMRTKAKLPAYWPADGKQAVRKAERAAFRATGARRPAPPSGGAGTGRGPH